MKDSEFENQPTPNSPQATLMSCTVSDAKQTHTAKEQCNNEKGSYSSLESLGIQTYCIVILNKPVSKRDMPKCHNMFLVSRYQIHVGSYKYIQS